MRNLNPKPFLYAIVGFSVIVWFILITISGFDINNLLSLLKPFPNVVTADALLVTVFIKWGWRLSVFHDWLVPFPDLAGTWQGSLQTDWKDENGNVPGPIPVILTIHQSFLHISCVMRTAEMESHSYAEGFVIDRERQIRQLCYSYTSKPRSSLRDRSTPHDGTILFRLSGEPVNKLVGEYWTQRKTTGTVTMTFKTKELLDELPTDIPAHPVASGNTQPLKNS